jgi:hypothetical protein
MIYIIVVRVLVIMRLGTWNVRSLYRVGSLMKVAKEISKYVRFSGSIGGQM